MNQPLYQLDSIILTGLLIRGQLLVNHPARTLIQRKQLMGIRNAILSELRQR
jgi:hypothetical protein